MSLIFGANTTSVVTSGQSTSINGALKFSAILQVYVTTLTDDRCFVTKFSSTGPRGWFFRMDGTGGNVQFIARGGTNANYITSDTPLAGTSAWAYLGVTFDSSVSTGQVHVYSGALPLASSSGVAERAYGTATDGLTYAPDSSSDDLLWGNVSLSSAALQGRENCVVFFKDVVLTPDQISSWVRTPRNQVDSVLAGVFHRLGNEGTGAQQDYSGNGNTGTVVACTQALNGPAQLQDYGWSVGDPMFIGA